MPADFFRSDSSVLSSHRLARPFLGLALLSALGLAGCGGKQSAAAQLVPGTEQEKPGGGSFFVDPNAGGASTRLHLAEMFWARLVDVYAVDAQGRVEAAPAFRDFAINENVRSDAGNYRLETNAFTQRTRLVILRQRGAAPDVGGGFVDLLRAAADGLAPVRPANDDGSSALVSFVARNATLVLRFDDALDDGPDGRRDLVETVRVRVGYPPTRPFGAREIFDPNHGTIVGRAFHSTRVLVDLTVSEEESAELSTPQPINTVGLPASLAGSSAADASVRLPTREDPGSGQFALLRTISGAPLAALENGPSDPGSPTRDVVRGLRSGNSEDQNNGFLLDLDAPTIVGEWAVGIEAAQDDPAGRAGFDFRLDARFPGPCRAAPRRGDVLASGDRFLEVLEDRPAPDGDGRVAGIRAHSLADAPLVSGSALLGAARFLSSFAPSTPVPASCWVRFSPSPAELPASGVATSAEARVRFSEPMELESISPFDNFYLVNGDENTTLTPRNRIVGEISASSDRREFTFRPSLPFLHESGASETRLARIVDPKDLAGNALASQLPAVLFTLAAEEPARRSLGTVMRFAGLDELEPIGLPDLRGQFVLDLEHERIRPRPVAFQSYAADRNHPVPSIMIPGPLPIQTPFSPLGSKLQTLWRYCDLGWQVLDESKYDLDVFGLAWTPFAGQVTSDFYERFEIRLAHSRLLPDESLDFGLVPAHEHSGLNYLHTDFAANILVDPLSPQKIVHPRELGYRIRGADLFTASSGTRMLPFPLNRGGGTPLTFTWRDTAVLAQGGPNGVGIPLDIEGGPPLFLEEHPGHVARANHVPSFGLPLLMEFRCFPSSTAIGLNGCDVSFAVNSSALPSFRSYSTGGTNSSGIAVQRDPDLEVFPHGAFNPRSRPPGQHTARSDDNTFYIGELDVVTRVSRVHTVWIDTQAESPDLRTPVVLPRADDQPPGTSVTLEYRGAQGFELADLDGALGEVVDEASFPFDAAHLDAYGDIFAVLPENGIDRREILGADDFPGRVRYVGGNGTWTTDIDALDGARYLQVRITFAGNITTGQGAELSAIGLPYSAD